MTQELLLLEREDHVLRITFNQPEKRNALGLITPELIRAIREADRDPEILCIVLTGAGSAFSAGGDLERFAAYRDMSAPWHYDNARASTELFALPAEIHTPIIAAVNGPAMGGGCGMVAMSHMAIASDRAVFATSEIKVGMFPYVILPWMMRALGEKKALELAFTGERFSADEACRWGLVHKVVPHEQLAAEAMSLAHGIGTRSPLVVRLGMEAYHKARDMNLKEAFDHLSTLRIVSFLSDDSREGAKAFLEKRAPAWSGR